MPRKRPNPLAPPTGDASDTTVPSSKEPREFKARMYRERLKPRSKDSKWTAKGYKAGTFRKRKKKPSVVLIGRDKGMYRKTDAGYKKRRFTFDQRQKFRARRQAPSWGPDSGRPKP
jgi:hypothetical protein